MKKQNYHYNIFLRPEPEGGFTALVPAWYRDASPMAVPCTKRKPWLGAIIAYIASLKKHREVIPTDSGTLVASLDFDYAKTA